jgi:hypothetical protein
VPATPRSPRRLAIRRSAAHSRAERTTSATASRAARRARAVSADYVATTSLSAPCRLCVVPSCCCPATPSHRSAPTRLHRRSIGRWTFGVGLAAERLALGGRARDRRRLLARATAGVLIKTLQRGGASLRARGCSEAEPLGAARGARTSEHRKSLPRLPPNPAARLTRTLRTVLSRTAPFAAAGRATWAGDTRAASVVLLPLTRSTTAVDAPTDIIGLARICHLALGRRERDRGPRARPQRACSPTSASRWYAHPSFHSHRGRAYFRRPSARGDWARVARAASSALRPGPTRVAGGLSLATRVWRRSHPMSCVIVLRIAGARVIQRRRGQPNGDTRAHVLAVRR